MKETKKYQDGQLSIIAIHATILSILTAVLTGYFFHVNSVLQQRELEVIDQAERINNVGFSPYYDSIQSHCDTKTLDNLSQSDLPNTKQVQNGLLRLFSLASLTPEDLRALKSGDSAPAVSKDFICKGDELVKLVNVLAHSYPFPHVLPTNPPERKMLSANPKPLVFANIEDVQSWLDDLNAILIAATPVLFMVDYGVNSDIKTYFQIFGQIHEMPIVNPPSFLENVDVPAMLELSGEINPQALFKNFVQGLDAAAEVAKATRYHINRLDRYRETRLPAYYVRLIIGITALAFILSVIIPMVFKSAPRMFWVWIPSIYYVVLLSVIFVQIK